KRDEKKQNTYGDYGCDKHLRPPGSAWRTLGVYPARGDSKPRGAATAVESADMSSSSRIRLAELVATLSLGTDLGLGQPMDHVLRQSLIALRLCAALRVTGDV